MFYLDCHFGKIPKVFCLLTLRLFCNFSLNDGKRTSTMTLTGNNIGISGTSLFIRLQLGNRETRHDIRDSDSDLATKQRVFVFVFER
jgi:hypothetical protein